ncbi:MAG: PHP domain-containing protein [Bacteroidetes bacterium]|nr:PHP domain-containing protein [Bacteroidota bacterium]
MTSNSDLIDDALKLPCGAMFYKCALQVNPHHYAETFRGTPNEGDATSHAQAVVEKAVQLGIKVLAITDHNNVSGVAAFRDAVRKHELHIFPGFELSSSEGIHVLCLYSPDVSDERLSRYLGEFGIRGTNPSFDLSNKTFPEILETVQNQGGISIAAHVTSNRGLFKELDGQARIHAWQNSNLLAIQIPGEVDELDYGIREIVENKNSDYYRLGTLEGTPAVAVVNAKDIAKPADLDHRSATCWIKMSEVGIDGLRQAFLDPESRIRLNPREGNLVHKAHAEIVSLAWQGGFLDDVKVCLNSNLNVLIGGRGTGKSTVIESIRAVLQLEPLGEDARRAYDGIVRQVLRNGTKITMLVRLHRPDERYFQIERTIPNPPVVREKNGKITNLNPSDVLPKVEVYGQHEISELTKSSQKLTGLLGRFIKHDESLTTRKASLEQRLRENRRTLCEKNEEIQDIRERLAALPALEETLKHYQEAGLEEQLREQSLLVREEQILEKTVPEYLQPFRETLESLQRELPIRRTFLSEKALENLPNKELLLSVNQVFADFEANIRKITDDLKQALQLTDRDIDQICLEWESHKQQVYSSYEEILRNLQKSRVDGEEFIRLRKKIEQLRPLQKRRKSLELIVEDATVERRELVAEWEDIKAEEFRIFDQAAKEVSRKLRGRVKVRVTAADNREPLFDILRKEIGGRLSETMEILRTTPDLSLTEFVKACRSGTGELQEVYGFSPRQAERISGADPEVYMKIEELQFSPTTTISLNTMPKGGDPMWQKLNELSTGQKATAVLLLLLLDSDAPLIVDQPEDDLDNRFITEGIVPRVREVKQRRQFIFSTHNANIPVLGDAEMILGLSTHNEAGIGYGSIAVAHMGAIDSQSVRELVEEILEGGREAFEIRRRKYGF